MVSSYKERADVQDRIAQSGAALKEAVAAPGGQVLALHTSLLRAVVLPEEDTVMQSMTRPADMPADWNADSAQDTDEYNPAVDPLFDNLKLDLSQCSMTVGLSVQGGGDEGELDRKASFAVPDAAMRISPVAKKYVREIAGGKYQWPQRQLVITQRKHATSAQNERYATEQAQAIMLAAEQLAEEHGDFEQVTPKALPYGHKQRRRTKTRKGKKGLAY